MREEVGRSFVEGSDDEEIALDADAGTETVERAAEQCVQPHGFAPSRTAPLEHVGGSGFVGRRRARRVRADGQAITVDGD